MTPREFLEKASQEIKKAKLHCAEPLQHAEQILFRTLQWDPAQLLLKKEDPLSPTEKENLKRVMERRLKGEPLQYILGFEYFYESKFSVGKGCLIPRRETELLVDEVLSFEPQKKLKVAELGAGSGNIGISVMLQRPEVEWHAFEINPETLPYLKKNQEALLTRESPYHIHFGDFFRLSHQQAPYDLVVSNPPYLSENEMASLSPEVKQEPPLALAGGGQEGLKIILALLEALPQLLKPQGQFLCEVGSDQASALSDILTPKKGMCWQIKKDLSHLPRILIVSLNGF